jgi:uncharacterized protein
MRYLESLDELHAAYGTPGEASLIKVTDHLTPAYHKWITRSRLCILSTIGPEGTDASPRGDDGPVIRVLDPRHIALPDWRGNERLDSLRNIIRDPRVSVMFLIAGSNNVIRINGTARITTDPDFCASFAREGKAPRSVTLIQITEVYSQCARALLRSRIWRDGDQSAGLPSVGDMLAEITAGGFDGATYDAEWPSRAAKTMW